MALRPESVRKAMWITSHFEGKGYAQVTGNFDGQGLSLGVFQWCWGQGSLQPLLRRTLARLGTQAGQLMDNGRLEQLREANEDDIIDAVAFGDSISMPGRKRHVIQPWRRELEAILDSEEGKRTQDEFSSSKVEDAIDLCSDFGFQSERALALMFDIAVQNGGIRAVTRQTIFDRFENGQTERERLEMVAIERANAARPAYRQDVLSRKLTIVRGQGTVHGDEYALEVEPGLTDEPFDDGV